MIELTGARCPVCACPERSRLRLTAEASVIDRSFRGNEVTDGFELLRVSERKIGAGQCADGGEVSCWGRWRGPWRAFSSVSRRPETGKRNGREPCQLTGGGLDRCCPASASWPCQRASRATHRVMQEENAPASGLIGLLALGAAVEDGGRSRCELTISAFPESRRALGKPAEGSTARCV